MPQLPRVGDVFGRYRIDGQIGQGGMGVVFSATDLAFDRRVALKVVSAALGDSSEFLARFEREAALLARLNSPHVIAIFDYGEQDGCPYLATQYVGGGDLGALLAARGPMPPQLAVTVCAQVADALGDAHRAGVVHRDVKPTNVLLRDADAAELHAYLCDFGIARTDAEGLTTPGSVSGTWSYLAPECGTGAPATVASDLYSLGCLLWAALTGRAPFRGTDVEIAIAHQRAPVPQLAGDDPFTRHVNAVLANTLAKDPRARYAHADELRADLLAAAAIPSAGVRPLPAPAPAKAATPTPGRSPAHGSPVPGSPVHGSPVRGPRRRRTAWLVAVATVAALAVTGGVVALTAAGGDRSDAAPRPTTATTTAEPTPTEPTPPEPAPVVGPVSGDLDGDGLGDLAVRERLALRGDNKARGPARGRGKDENHLLVWHSTGSEFADPVVRLDKAEGDPARDRVAADLDGDDLLDTVVVDAPGAPKDLRVTAELTAGGSLAERLPRPRGGSFVTTFPGDADGDGLDDLLLLAYDERRMSMWVARSTGSSLERPRRVLDLDTGYERSEVEVGDFDGDDRADVAVLTDPPRGASGLRSSPRSTLDVYVPQADGRLASDGHARAFPTRIGHALLAGDFDGDEDSELALLQDRTTFVQISILDHGSEGMRRPKGRGLIPTPPGGFFHSTLVTGDYDGDGLDDIVRVGPSADAKVAEIHVARSNGRRFAPASRWATWRFDLGGRYGTDVVGSSFP